MPDCKGPGLKSATNATKSSKQSGLIQLFSEQLNTNGYQSLPGYTPVNSFNEMKDDDLHLIPYNINVQTGSVTQNCKWLNEISDQNHVWIHPKTAEKYDIKQGDKVSLKSSIGTVTTFAKITQLVMPGILSLASVGGHWESGRFASGNRAPFAMADNGIKTDNNPWWLAEQLPNVHPNWLIPVVHAQITGQQCWNDNLVTIKKA